MIVDACGKECCMMDTIIRMQKDTTDSIRERKENERDTRKEVSDLAKSQDRNTMITEQIQKTQEQQSIDMEKHQISTQTSTKEYQVETARLSKEAADKVEAYFKANDDRRIASEKAAELAKEEQAKALALKHEQEERETARLKEKAEDEIKENKKWKFRVLVGLGISAFLLFLNIAIGLSMNK